MIGVIINGRQLPNVELERGFEIPSFNFENEYTEVPGRPGAIKIRRQLKALDFDLPLIYKNHYDKRTSFEIIEEITGYINYYDPVPLQFTDQNWYWKAEFDGPFNIATNTNGFVTFSLSVRIADPYKYSVGEKTEPLPASSSATFVANEGTADTHPHFKINVNVSTTLLTVENLDNLTPQGTPKQVILGIPESPEDTQVDPLTLVMHDSMRSTASWQTASEVDNGYISGEMGVNQHGFYADKYGTVVNPQKWQGPSLIRGIGQSLQNFRADVFIRQFNVGYGTGMIEVYFRDANGNRIAKIGFEDRWDNIDENVGKAYIGYGNNPYAISAKADNRHIWNNFNGLMRIERVGKVWEVYFSVITPDGRHISRRGPLRYTDNAGTAAAPITHVQVAIRKFPLTEATDQAVKEIKIYRVNQANSGGSVPVSFKPGDVVEIDASSGLAMVNGEPRMDLVDLDTDFFTLIPGYNRIKVSPAFDADVTFKNRYL